MTALESSKLFAGLSAAELKQLRGVAQEMRFAAKQQIFQEGAPGDGLYLVKSGRVEISARISAEDWRVFAHVLPGDVFGEMAVLDRQPRSACALAEVDTEVYFIPSDPVWALIQQSPALAIVLVREISGRLRDFNRQYIREVLQAERMTLVGRFASAIVHDLKNPLTIIRVASDVVCTETATAETRKVARERIGKEVERITHLVNDILDFTRGAPPPVALPSVDYGRFVEGLIGELQTEIAAKGVKFEYLAPPPAVKVALHPQRLSRVFSNLIENAIDAMPNGGTIKLRFEVLEKEVVTELQDTGPGIAPEIQDRIFEAFATYGKASGTGLGLSIAQRIVEEHRGKISARNLPGGGAAFTFNLPRVAAAA